MPTISVATWTMLGTIVTTRISPKTRDLALLVRCDVLVTYAGEATRSFVVVSRLEGRPLAGIARGEEVPCNIIGIDESKASRDNPFDLSEQPPGGIFLIGSTRMEKDPVAT